jgi:hypothetical protein
MTVRGERGDDARIVGRLEHSHDELVLPIPSGGRYALAASMIDNSASASGVTSSAIIPPPPFHAIR